MPVNHLGSIVAFLGEIGIAIREGPIPDDTFLPGLCISHGTLLFDRALLKWPGDLLHEAGHLAVTPAAQRHQLDDRLSGEIEAPHAGEIEATAWSFAAATHLGLPLSELFHSGGYRGCGDRLVFTFSSGCYPGAAGLAAAGMTATGADARALGIPAFPHMLRWLRG
jgi:hypothetical protein